MLIAKTEEIPAGSSLGFSFEVQGGKLEGFVVNKAGNYYAFRNSCPHVGAPLNWMPDEFLDPNNEYIQCTMHGALFEMDSGLCVSGPCASQSLEPIHIRVVDGEILLA